MAHMTWFGPRTVLFGVRMMSDIIAHKAWILAARFDLRVGARKEKKGQNRTGKKSQKGYTSPIWGEAPTQTICIKNCVVAYLLDVITCPKFQNEIFRGYHFTWGRIFHFPIDIWMGLTKVQRYCATCDVVYIFSLFLLIRRNVRNRKVTKSVSC